MNLFLPAVLCPAAQQTRHIDPMLDQCWPTVYDVGPTLFQHWIDAPYLLGVLLY